MVYRKTEAKIYLNNIKDNVRTIINNFSGYKYYIGVVKADSYGHNSKKVVQSIIDGGCNYLAVSSLDEALTIRKSFNVPILCLGIINPKHFSICEKNNIDVTIDSINQMKQAKKHNIKIHLKIDTGMNRLGIKNKDDFEKIINETKNSKVTIQGIYTHIYEANNSSTIKKQIKMFKNIVSSVDLKTIPMIHIAQSETLINYPKIDFCNGCRLGIIMYGLIKNTLNLKNTISLTSEIVEIKNLQKGETVSYNGIYTAKQDESIGIVSIGYADGINRKLTGSFVYINNKPYEIVGSICMDMLMIKIDQNIKLYDTVFVYKDIQHIQILSTYLKTIPYELICNISKRVPRKYIKNA